MSPNDLPIPIRTAAAPSIRWLADVVCYLCGSLESDCVVIQLASGRAALEPTHSVALGLRWRAGRPLCPRCGGAVFLDDIHMSEISGDESFAAPSRRRAATSSGDCGSRSLDGSSTVVPRLRVRTSAGGRTSAQRP
jgi:hypothetical protein